MSKTRREILKAGVAATFVSTVPHLGGCEDDDPYAGCREGIPTLDGLGWISDITHPVFYGFKDLGVADGAPGPLRIWYPTYEGFTDGPPILRPCTTRWPLVLFLHGHAPDGCKAIPNYYRYWTMLPAVLARVGYVVVVPDYSGDAPLDEGSVFAPQAITILNWVRTGWEHRYWVDQREERTAVAGHSHGALQAAVIANQNPSIAAYVGWSGPWNGPSKGIASLTGIGAPTFFMWATDQDDIIAGTFDDLSANWNSIPSPKTRGDFAGEHFDQLRTFADCEYPTGPCHPLVGAAAADLAALFIARHLPVHNAAPQVPASLIPPPASYTPEQQNFLGGHLAGYTQFQDEEGCRINLAWDDPLDPPGQRVIGS